MSIHVLPEVTLDVPHLQAPEHGEETALQESNIGKVVLRNHGRRDRHPFNGNLISRPKSEYISPGQHMAFSHA